MTPGTERTEQAFVRAALAGTRLGDVRWIAETGSTNDDLSALARDGADEQVLITDLQTAGRGRRDRIWDAPSGSGILMSVLLRGQRIEDGFWSVGAVALAASHAIDEITNRRCSLKWPNDVMVGPKKVAGVLAQVVEDVVVVGIGINVNWPDEVPAELRERGTAVNWNRKDRTFLDRAPLAVVILQGAMRHLDADRETLRSNWKAQCSTLGQQVRLELAGGAIVGNAVDIAPDGALQIEESGVRSTHQVGDVVHLRPAF